MKPLNLDSAGAILNLDNLQPMEANTPLSCFSEFNENNEKFVSDCKYIRFRYKLLEIVAILD